MTQSNDRSTERRRPVPILAAAALAGALALGACANMNNTEQRTLSGGAIGAGVGAVGTALTGGCVWCGAAIGGAVGAGAGYLYDRMENDRR
jgi:osmotically inducible lipoprotein OsmB